MDSPMRWRLPPGRIPSTPIRARGWDLTPGSGGSFNAQWSSEPGKLYTLEGSPTLAAGSWQALGTFMGDGGAVLQSLTGSGQPRWFFRLKVQDVDSDIDGLTDWEEARLGFDPHQPHSDRNDTADFTRVTSSWNAANTITAGLIQGGLRVDWPAKGIVAIRRSGGLKPLTVNVTFAGSATRGTEYTTNIPANQVTFPLGAREAWIELSPVSSAVLGATKTIIVTVAPGTGYSIGSTSSVTTTIDDASPFPCARAAARFLMQAAFGPDQDSTGDADDIPENVEEVMTMGFSRVDRRPVHAAGRLSSAVGGLGGGECQRRSGSTATTRNSPGGAARWARRSCGPMPPATQLPDPLRQRVAFALSEILVASDRPEALAVEQQGMANYYDLMVQHAFGNYRDLLYDVATASGDGHLPEPPRQPEGQPRAQDLSRREFRARDHAALQHRAVGAEPRRHAQARRARASPSRPTTTATSPNWRACSPGCRLRTTTLPRHERATTRSR